MGVVILQPQGCLRDPFPHETLIYDPMRSRRQPNPNRSNRRKRSPSGLQHQRHHHPPRTMVAKLPTKNLVMGQVKILKRGEDEKETTTQAPSDPKDDDKKPKIESLKDPNPILADPDSILCSTDRWGPDPEVVPTQILSPDFYAGSAFITSPPPSSLPLPAFVMARNDDATSDLRRILRLDLP